MTRPDFRDAECRRAPDSFFPDGRSQVHLRRTEEAKAMRARCPFREPCLEVALTERDHNGRWYSGIWAGTVESERDALRRKR
jgi:hypothetical protein